MPFWMILILQGSEERSPVSILASCAESCAQPGLPGTTDQDQPTFDTGPVEDSGDTAMELPCPFPEEEPNDSIYLANEVGLGQWVCGDLFIDDDQDITKVLVEEEGWIRVWARGADIGSGADLQMSFIDETQEFGIILFDHPFSTDPKMVAPLPPGSAGRWFYPGVYESQLQGGDDHIWEMVTNMTKAPVEWTVEEDELPVGSEVGLDLVDGQTDGQFIESGDRVFGIHEASTDSDWYQIVLPEDGCYTIDATVEAANYGSPLYSYAKLNDPNGETKRTGSFDQGHEEPDLEMSFNTSDAGDWAIGVWSSNSTGSVYHWYVLEVTVSDRDPDECASKKEGKDSGDTGVDGDSGK